MGNATSKPTIAMAPTNQNKTLPYRGRATTKEHENDAVHVERSEEGESFPEKRQYREAEGLPVDVLAEWQTEALKDPKNRLALTALGSTDPKKVLLSIPTKIQDQHLFNIAIPLEGSPITNQHSSGRCWLFAATNVCRVPLMRRHNLDGFEFSQAYLFFWDKLEKANWFLEQVVLTAGEDLEGRLVQHMLKDLVSDGGQWDMFYNLVSKYGLVPQVLYPDRWNASNSRILNTVVKKKLREFALELRRISVRGTASDISAAKAKMMEEISLILTLLLGPPPKPDEEFTWQFADKNKKVRELTTTPKEFVKEIASLELRFNPTNLDSLISLVHDPRHEPNTLLTVDRLGNIVGGRPVTYVNVTIDTLKSACVKMLKAGLPIFFGSDVGQFSDNESGVMDLDIFDYALGLGTSVQNTSKADRLRSGESQMTHAMVLTAVHVDEKTGNPVRWRVQNSWGPDTGDKGFFVMSDRWLDEYVYQAVVDPKFVSKEVQDVLKQDPVVLPLWDPMGSLA